MTKAANLKALELDINDCHDRYTNIIDFLHLSRSVCCDLVLSTFVTCAFNPMLKNDQQSFSSAYLLSTVVKPFQPRQDILAWRFGQESIAD